MKKQLMILSLVVFLITSASLCWSSLQDNQAKTDEEKDNRVELSLLLPPSSPGFTILNKEFASVDRPGTVADFAVLVQTKTANFTTLPEDYALEFSPYWIFWGKNLSYSDYCDDKLPNNILQSLSISIASATDPDPADRSRSLRSMGFGLKFSLLRGKIQQRWENIVKPLQEYHKTYVDILQSREQNDPKLDELKKELKDKVHDNVARESVKLQIELRKKEIQDQLSAEMKMKEKEKELSDTSLKRVGIKWDVAGGAALTFPQDTFDKGSLSRLGIWTTLGYEWDAWSALAVARYFHDQSGPEKDSYDLGVRFIWDKDRLSVSGEGVLRFVDNGAPDLSRLWRLALICSYDLGSNKSLQFVFGRDYKGEKTGNLISLVNFIIGLGSQRPIFD